MLPISEILHLCRKDQSKKKRKCINLQYIEAELLIVRMTMTAQSMEKTLIRRNSQLKRELKIKKIQNWKN
jgi:hypothetical protein